MKKAIRSCMVLAGITTVAILIRWIPSGKGVAQEPAKAEADGFGVLMAGSVTEDGKVTREGGAKFKVKRDKSTSIRGLDPDFVDRSYTVTFAQDLDSPPVVIVTAENADAFMRIISTTNSGFTVVARALTAVGGLKFNMADCAFSFIVVKVHKHNL